MVSPTPSALRARPWSSVRSPRNACAAHRCFDGAGLDAHIGARPGNHPCMRSSAIWTSGAHDGRGVAISNRFHGEHRSMSRVPTCVYAAFPAAWHALPGGHYSVRPDSRGTCLRAESHPADWTAWRAGPAYTCPHPGHLITVHWALGSASRETSCSPTATSSRARGRRPPRPVSRETDTRKPLPAPSGALSTKRDRG